MRRAIIVSSPNAYRFNADLVVVAMEDILRKRGFDVLQLTREALPPATNSDDIFFFCQLSVPPAFRVSTGQKIIFNFHPTCPDAHYGKHAYKIFCTIRETIRNHWANFIFDYSEVSTNWMLKKDLPAIFCPLGYHKSFEVGEGRSLTPGVFFIGRARGKRKLICDATKARIMQNCWGHERALVLRTPGVHLSLRSYQPFRTFLSLRSIVLLASNARCIVQEESDWCPLVNEEHCLIRPEHEIPGVVEELLKSPGLCEMFGAKVHQFVKTKHRFDDSFNRAMAMAGLY